MERELRRDFEETGKDDVQGRKAVLAVIEDHRPAVLAFACWRRNANRIARAMEAMTDVDEARMMREEQRADGE